MLYTFRCECLHKFDELFTVAERPDALPCPKCGKQAKRIISISTVDTESECPDWIPVSYTHLTLPTIYSV